MIERALKLRQRINYFVFSNLERTHGSSKKATAEEKEARLDNNKVGDEDWAILSEMMDILEPFWKLTMRMQGHGEHEERGVLWEYLVSLNHLTEHLRTKKDQYDALVNNAETSNPERNPGVTNCYAVVWFLSHKTGRQRYAIS